MRLRKNLGELDQLTIVLCMISMAFPAKREFGWL